MITKMKKLTFLIYHKEYESFLAQIREMGVVHIVEKQCGETDDNLRQLLQRHARYKSLLNSMNSAAGKQTGVTLAPETSGDAIVQGYESLQNQIQELAQQLPLIEKEVTQLEPWGDFEPEALERLKEAGWNIRFYVCSEKDYRGEWEETYNAIRVAEKGGYLYFITVTPGVADLEIEPVRMPASSLTALKRKQAQTAEALALAKERLQAFCAVNSGALETFDLQLQGDIDLVKVRLDGERMAEGALVLLEGWIPEENEPALTELLDRLGVYYEVRKAKKEDNAPIKLKNNAFTRMYEVLTGMYGMPEYAEFDPTPILAPFFSLFFGFCMGDAGYGLVLIALGFILKKKLSSSLKGMMNLVISLGIFTTVMGAILGTFFGVSLFNIDLPDCIKQFMIVGKIGDTSYDKQMLLALIIGVVHICLAMTVKAVCHTVRYGFKESLSTWGWLLLVVGFFCTGGLTFFEVISAEVSTWAFIVIGGISAIGIYLLNNIHRNVFINIGAGLWDTYNMVTGLLGDILSYIRLYALGLAGAMLGGVFNQLAMMVNDGCGPYVGWLFCGLILIAGHTLNIAMSCLSAFVHPLRLTFVEYFKNSGYNGKGQAYKPFSLVKK